MAQTLQDIFEGTALHAECSDWTRSSLASGAQVLFVHSIVQRGSEYRRVR
jgi:hypothetical protein